MGRRSKTDVIVGYIEDVADPSLVQEVKDRIGAIDRDAIPMGGKNLEEYILGTVFNPLPVTRYTERPDVAAAHLLEGHVVIIVDTTPFALIVPVTLWHFTQHAEEYFQNPPVGTYLRWVRTAGIVGSWCCCPVVHFGREPQSSALDLLHRTQGTGTLGPVAAAAHARGGPRPDPHGPHPHTRCLSYFSWYCWRYHTSIWPCP